MYEKHESCESLELASAQENRVGIDKYCMKMTCIVVRWICNAWCECWVNNEAIGPHIRVGIGATRGTMGGNRNHAASFVHQVFTKMPIR